MENKKLKIINKEKANHISKEALNQHLDSELKRFKSHQVYQIISRKNKKTPKNEKKNIINISKIDKMKPKSKKSHNNSNKKHSSSKIVDSNEFSQIEGKQLIKMQKTMYNKSKSKIMIGTNNYKEKGKLTENSHYSNKANGTKNKILNEAMKKLDIGDNNINIIKINKTKIIVNNSKQVNNSVNKLKNININNKNSYTNNINMNLTNNYYIENNGKNRIFKNINFGNLHNSSNNINTFDLNINEAFNNENKNIIKNRELLIISKKGDKEKLLELLSFNQININFQNENGWSALHFACDEGNLKIVDLLIKSKIDLNLKNIEKKTALHISVLRGYFDITKLLLENGANINVKDNEKNLPLHICASQGHDELLNFILEKNPIGIKEKNLFGKTPLDMAVKESTKTIINKFLNQKKNNIIKITDKNKNNISPKLNNNNNNSNNITNHKYNQSNNNKNQFSRIKIHKTNKSQIKSLMIPISKSHFYKNLNKNNNDININNISNNDINNRFKKNGSKIFNVNNFSKVNTLLNNQDMNVSGYNINNTSNTLNTFNIINSSTIPSINNYNSHKNPLKGKKNKINRNISSSTKQEIKTSKIKINLSSSTKYANHISININKNNNNFKTLSNNTKYLNFASNKRKAILNFQVLSNNNNSVNINKSNSPTKDPFMKFNTSSNIYSSSKKRFSTSNNSIKISEFYVGNDIFFGKEKHKVKGKIINIPKRLNKKKVNRSQSKNNKINSVWKTAQNERAAQNFSPNIKCLGIPKKNSPLFIKEDNKIINSLSKRTISVPRFLDTEYILEKPLNKKGLKREKSVKNKFKFPKKIINNSNSIMNEKYKNKEIKNIKGKSINNGVKGIKKQNSYKNNNNIYKSNNKEIKNKQIYTEEDANFIEDLEEEETIIEINKDKKKDIKKIKKKNSKEIKNSLNINNNNNNSYNSYNNTKKIETIESDDEFNDIEELEDSFEISEESEGNKEEKIGPTNFVCLALLGQGSFGEVYLVKKKDSDDFYAMKVLDKSRIAKQNIFKYVLTERNVLSVMHYPFIVKLNYAFQTSEKLFLLLDYCPGGDLSKQLQIQTRFSEEKAKFYICEIILALGELHKNNIIFRDLKPDNVVIDKEGHALLTDFGLSREGVFGKEIAKSFCGSIAYLAPEMLNRCGHGKAVDWYLLGVLFYELLVGVPPYFNTNQEQIFRNIQKGELYIPPFVSLKAQNLIKSLLKRNPNERLGSKRDVEEIKENEYFSDVDWKKVYERKYKPPPIYLKSNHLQFFRQPVQFKENEEDDLFVKDNNNDNNRYNQDIENKKNKYEGWSFVKK